MFLQNKQKKSYIVILHHASKCHWNPIRDVIKLCVMLDTRNDLVAKQTGGSGSISGLEEQTHSLFDNTYSGKLPFMTTGSSWTNMMSLLATIISLVVPVS